MFLGLAFQMKILFLLHFIHNQKLYPFILTAVLEVAAVVRVSVEFSLCVYVLDSRLSTLSWERPTDRTSFLTCPPALFMSIALAFLLLLRFEQQWHLQRIQTKSVFYHRTYTPPTQHERV